MNRARLVLALLLLPFRAFAHPLDLGYLVLTEREGVIEAILEVNPRAAEEFLVPTLSLPSSDAVLRARDALVQATFGSASISLMEGDRCSWIKGEAAWIDDQRLRISAQAVCVPQMTGTVGQLKIDLGFLKRVSSSYQVLGKAEFGGQEHSFLVEPRSPSARLVNDAASPEGFGSFVKMGVKHIGAAPSEWIGPGGVHFPDGIDHILFLLALILGGGGFWRILKTATGFTLGHSVTLALASLGILRLPGRLVESAIALSIVYVAYEALTLKDSRSRWKIAAVFGLVHGFGFASALEELHLGRHRMLEALVGFNVGVELGQALIIALVVPVVLLARSRPIVYEVAVRGCALGIGAAGSLWFFQRAFGF